MIQDPYTNSKPVGTIVTENHVGKHRAYGIMAYIGLSANTPHDSMTIIANNVVQDILGTSISGASGAGIFIQGAEGAIVDSNTVTNCCRSTTNFDTLNIAGISAATGEYGTGDSVPISISNNKVFAQRGPGIFAAASERSCRMVNNTVYSTGTAAVRGEGIIAISVNGAKIDGNVIYHKNTNYAALKFTAASGTYKDISISGNLINTLGYGMILNQSSGTIEDASITNNNVTAVLTALSCANVTDLKIEGNTLKSETISATVQACPRTIMSTNNIRGTTYSVIFGSGNTNSSCDETNILVGLVENNVSSGMLISQYGDSAPAIAGLWQPGDRVIKRTSVVGQPKGWRNTIAGNPGTWTSEGNL